jgi:glycogen debranching enzyme
MIPAACLGLQRKLLIDDSLYIELELVSFVDQSVVVPLALALEADFADLFEVRDIYRRRPGEQGRRLEPTVSGSRVVFAYEGRDDVAQETLVSLDPAPKRTRVDRDGVSLTWELTVGPRARRRLAATATPSGSGSGRGLGRRAFAQLERELDRAAEEWVSGCTKIETDNALFQRVIDASLRDLRALLIPTTGSVIPAAGIPWYVAPFGRDALVAACQCLLVNPQIAQGTLMSLAALRAQADDPWRDAEPGKIPHEVRTGELSRMRAIPHSPYYGTVDATPLFVMLAADYFQWTADVALVRELRPALDAALAWIDRHGDCDGDGFVEYRCRSPAGLRNQGWKDSPDSILHADGTPAEAPIALVEVQGYVYAAKTRIAAVYEALGDGTRASELRAEARTLRRAFNAAFWDERQGFFVVALDGRKRPVASVTSNPGHCLYCGIVDPAKAPALAERLMAPDMFSGWGIRTLSAESPAYNPMSYHNGSVWPHDNAIIAAGLKRYGYSRAAGRITAALFELGASTPDQRLAELYCGFPRGGHSRVVEYPLACRPQAWAAGAPFMLLQAILGLEPRAARQALAAVKPHVPESFGRVKLTDLRVGEASADLTITRRGALTRLLLDARRGELAVTQDDASFGEAD